MPSRCPLTQALSGPCRVLLSANASPVHGDNLISRAPSEAGCLTHLPIRISIYYIFKERANSECISTFETSLGWITGHATCQLNLDFLETSLCNFEVAYFQLPFFKDNAKPELAVQELVHFNGLLLGLLHM